MFKASQFSKVLLDGKSTFYGSRTKGKWRLRALWYVLEAGDGQEQGSRQLEDIGFWRMMRLFPRATVGAVDFAGLGFLP